MFQRIDTGELFKAVRIEKLPIGHPSQRLQVIAVWLVPISNPGKEIDVQASMKFRPQKEMIVEFNGLIIDYVHEKTGETFEYVKTTGNIHQIRVIRADE